MSTVQVHRVVMLLLYILFTAAGILTTDVRIPFMNLILLLSVAFLSVAGFYATTEEDYRKKARQRVVGKVIAILLAPIGAGNIALEFDLPFPAAVYHQDYVVATLLLVIVVSVTATFWPAKVTPKGS